MIAVPSYGRADRVRVFETFPDALLWVPESQEAAYVTRYGREAVRPVPDAVEGNLARKLNYMLRAALEQGVTDWLRIDDDVYGVGMWEGDEHYQLAPDEAAALVDDGFRMAREAGAHLWGLNLIKDKRAYSVFRPLKLLAPVLGPWMGHALPHGVWYDERMGAKEDYDLWLQMIARYRRTLRFDKFHYLKKEETVGGWYSERSQEREREWAARIVGKWGKVIKYDSAKKNLLDGRVNIPIKGC